MDTKEIERSLRNRIGNKLKYLGTVTSDYVSTIKIDKYRSQIIGFISNTLESSDDSNLMGHWVAFAIDKSPNDRIIFFDSYGFNIDMYNGRFKQFLKNNETFRVFSFDRQYQPDISYKCGLYAIFFIHFISYFGIRQTILKVKNTLKQGCKEENDRYVTKYYFRYLSSGNCKEWRINSMKRAITFRECRKLLQ